MKFDHLGIAVSSIEEYFNKILKPVFRITELTEIIIDPIQKSKIAFATSSNGFRLELIQPLTDDSPVNQILQKKKGGLYHMCFVADNFNEDVKNCVANKFIAMTQPQPAVAFNNRRVIFFTTPSYELIELVEEER
jgi:methylmalonyl-CoA/ethylmalonyl-CoA epimerase